MTGRVLEAAKLAERLRNYIAAAGLQEGDRLPPERELALELGLSRYSLRLALATAEDSGQIRRRVGKGTFVGSPRPSSPQDLAAMLARNSNPMELIEARAIIEPRLAALAAIRGSPDDFARLKVIVANGRQAKNPSASDRHGTEFHLAIAKMARNRLLGGLFETIFEIRNRYTWGKLRASDTNVAPLALLWYEHEQIADAIMARDAREAEGLMRRHFDELHQAISNQDVRSQGKRPKNAAGNMPASEST